jgi:hypothetical protein
MKLGDLDALKKVINKIIAEEIEIDEKWAKGLKYSLKIIDNAPTVESEVYMTAKDYDLYLEGYKQGKEDFARSQDEWIPIRERLPEYSGLYLISVDDLVTVANFTGTYFMRNGGGRVEVYAWQPLPEPYKAGGKEE